MDAKHEQAVERAVATALVRALRMALLVLHKAALDAERRRYERSNGRIETPRAVLRLVLDDPWFEWLHPITALIVQMDGRLAEEAALDPVEAETFANRVRGLLQRREGSERFQAEYRRMLQEAPEVVVAHGRLAELLGGPVTRPPT
jgi:hypothetical protein